MKDACRLPVIHTENSLRMFVSCKLVGFFHVFSTKFTNHLRKNLPKFRHPCLMKGILNRKVHPKNIAPQHQPPTSDCIHLANWYDHHAMLVGGFSPTPLKNIISSNWIISPGIRVKNQKKMSCHHLSMI